MKKSDVIIIVVVLALAGIIVGANFVRGALLDGNSLTADIYVDGNLYKSVPITQKEQTVEVSTKYGKNTVKVHDDGVEISDADCPDKLCTGFGFQNKAGDQIVCLPHHLYVEVR
jgi:hypothetical protein